MLVTGFSGSGGSFDWKIIPFLKSLLKGLAKRPAYASYVALSIQ